MMMRASSLARRSLLAGFLLVGLSAYREPEENLGPDHADDPRWSQFRGVKVKTDLVKGIATAAFPSKSLISNNKIMDNGGYMIPLKNNMDTTHFLLPRRSSGCPFCLPDEANEAVEVFTSNKVHYDQQQIY